MKLLLGGLLLASGLGTAPATIEPTLFSPWQSGDAAAECMAAGGCGTFAFKIDAWAPGGVMDGTYAHAGNIIEISGSTDGKTFTWTSTYEVCAVIVKGGPDANVYQYGSAEPSCGDTEMYAPANSSGMPADISHVTFCWNQVECGGGNPTCYVDETAWSAGPRYTLKGNWATYTGYSGVEKVVTLYAGRTHVAGTVTFSAPISGEVTITIDLNPGFIFYYDLADPFGDDNVKVQDYESVPSGNPAPGSFEWKAFAEVSTSSYVMVVPANSYYGVHVDLARAVPCD